MDTVQRIVATIGLTFAAFILGAMLGAHVVQSEYRQMSMDSRLWKLERRESPCEKKAREAAERKVMNDNG